MGIVPSLQATMVIKFPPLPLSMPEWSVLVNTINHSLITVKKQTLISVKKQTFIAVVYSTYKQKSLSPQHIGINFVNVHK